MEVRIARTRKDPRYQGSLSLQHRDVPTLIAHRAILGFPQLDCAAGVRMFNVTARGTTEANVGVLFLRAYWASSQCAGEVAEVGFDACEAQHDTHTS
jgi:hypothetical protein